jgi:hypothetical protein
MAQTQLPASDASGWTLLARGDQDHDEVSRCPAGHIHLDYGNFSVRFHRDEFLAFARMVMEAAAHLAGRQPAPVQPTTFSRN